MADIRPFRSWRYNPGKISDINLKFSPLFDVVTPEQLAFLYSIENNSIHLSVPKSMMDAVNKLREWKSKEIIVQDTVPNVFVYYQDFSVYGKSEKFTRKGFVCMVRMNGRHDKRANDIVLHEDTIASSVNDRIALLENTMLNVSPTHGLYNDPGFQLEPLMDRCMENPEYEYMDYQGVINKLAIVSNEKDIRIFVSAMRGRKIYLADGHHRLAGSQAVQDKFRKNPAGLPADSMVNYHSMYLTNLCSDDLQILPIHRVLTPGEMMPTIEDFLLKFSGFFVIHEATLHREPLYAELARKKGCIGMIFDGRQFVLEMKNDADRILSNPLPIPDQVKLLDYTVVHYFIFDRIFGLRYETQSSVSGIRYEKDYYSAVKAADRGKPEVSFVVNGIGMKEMLSVCESGALMPRKSTYFYPKVLCGLVFASIDDKENNSPLDAGFRLPEEEAASRGTRV